MYVSSNVVMECTLVSKFISTSKLVLGLVVVAVTRSSPSKQGTARFYLASIFEQTNRLHILLNLQVISFYKKCCDDSVLNFGLDA